MQKILVGADPEVAIVQNDQIIPCVGVVEGTKHSPLVVEGSAVGLRLQEDGVSLEFNLTPTPVEKFSATIALAMAELQTQVLKYFGKGSYYYLTDGHAFKEEQLTSKQARTFGCDPDYLAYDRGDMRKRPSTKAMGNSRFFAGHLHIGYDKSKCKVPDWAIVQGIEALAYIKLIMSGYDRQPSRRKFYGIPGLYRPKEYGLEWRTPSNAWISHPTRFVTPCMDIAQNIINKPGKYQEIYQSIDWSTVHKYISTEGASYPSELWLDDMLYRADDLRTAPNEEI